MPHRFLRRIGIALLLGAALGCAEARDFEGSPRKVYVMLGMHMNFYHSWRGDTPDEAGFGTDIRLVRAILDMLDEANAQGLDARVYWDSENLFTLEEILPRHAPDILRDLRRRVGSGRDEALLMSYSNSLLAAMTDDELRATLRWSISNPWGSGAKDVFGRFTPIVRPQEYTTTTGLGRILAEEGIEGVVLAYSGYPFDATSSFLPLLAPEQRYGATWLRFEPDGPRTIWLPAASIGDVLNQVSLERWMLDLRRLQLSGAVDRDLVIHLNFDADAESWLPQALPPGLGWIPNAGGLREYIEAVNQYDWAEFTTPARYLAEHEPVGEVQIRQDLADGAFNGHYSWAEKFSSHALWTDLERSRLATQRAAALLRDAPHALRAEAEQRLREGRESSFFQRLRGLSTTHFGMSTPTINEERLAVGERVIGAALAQAEAAEAAAAQHIAQARPGAAAGVLYAFQVRDLREPGVGGEVPALLRIPLIVADPLPGLEFVRGDGAPLEFSLVDLRGLGNGEQAAELWALLPLAAGQVVDLELRSALRAAAPVAPSAPGRLANEWLAIEFDARHGIARIESGDWLVGGEDFLEPFIGYRAEDEPERFGVEGFERLAAGGERLQGLQRVRLRGEIPLRTPGGEARAVLRVDFSLPAREPWLIADVDIAYPYTEKRELIDTIQQKLRRYIDERWIEVAPFALRPRFEATRAQPLRVWKHNWLDVTSYYDLDYGQINPANAEIEAFNHQVTAGWVALGDRRRGLLLAQDSDRRSSYAFAPMRLTEIDGRQSVQINPFGSYHGPSLDYSHLGGNGIGTAFAELFSASIRPNGPSYNGERERFSLLIAPYRGDAPPAPLQAVAQAFARAPAIAVTHAPLPARRPADLAAEIAERELAQARRRGGPLAPPRAFLANPSAGAVDAVWDPSPDPRVEAYEIAWRPAGSGAGAVAQDWRLLRAEGQRLRIAGLADGQRHAVRMRALGPAGATSPWTPAQEVVVGAVAARDAVEESRRIPLRLMLRTFAAGLDHLRTTP